MTTRFWPRPEAEYDEPPAAPPATPGEPPGEPGTGEGDPGGETNYKELYEKSEAARTKQEVDLNEAKTAYAADQKAWEARMGQFERLVGSQSAQAPAPAAPASAQPTWEDDPRGATETYINERMGDQNRKMAGVMGAWAERSFKNDMANVQKLPHYGQVANEMDAFFQQNPAAKLQDGAAEAAYRFYVGDKFLNGGIALPTEAPAELGSPVEPQAPQRVSPAAPTAAAPASPQGEPPSGPPEGWSELHEHVANGPNGFNKYLRRMGKEYEISPDEWMKIEKEGFVP